MVGFTLLPGSAMGRGSEAPMRKSSTQAWKRTSGSGGGVDRVGVREPFRVPGL
jgi:hypothetical protein